MIPDCVVIGVTAIVLTIWNRNGRIQRFFWECAEEALRKMWKPQLRARKRRSCWFLYVS